MKEEKENIPNEVTNISGLSELDLLSDDMVWMLVHRLKHIKVKERSFVEDYEIISVDRNDELMVILSKLHNAGGFKIYWDGKPLDKIFFFVGNSTPSIAYTKRYKGASPQDTNSGSGSE